MIHIHHSSARVVLAAALVRYFVDTLFAESIVQLTSAEDEIWMVESGMKNRVHIWRKVSP